MASTGEPPHLNSHHRETLAQIFEHPTSHNIQWRSVLSLLEAVGSVEEHRDGRFVVTLGGETKTFEVHGDKDIDTEQLVDLRRMLRNAGYEAESDEHHKSP